MKKLLVLSLGALALVVNLTSCKKGENDPFLSLSSRKARLAAEWTLTKSESTDVYNGNNGNDDYVQTTISTYNGTVETGTETTVTNGVSETVDLTPDAYTVNFTIEKDGTFIYEYKNADGTTKYEGNWMFLGKNKSTELKKKEAISLSFTKFTETDVNGVSTSTSGKDLDGWVLLIDQLKKKEIILIDESTYTNQDGKTNSYKTVNTFTSK